MKKIVYLSGGIGGAKLAKGFYHSKDVDLTIIINTGDDEVIHGVPLSPDIDSVMYALGGIEGEMGWGIANDTFSVSDEYKKFIPQNFSIGDKDLALNLYRNQLLSEGKSLTEITKLFAEHLNLECNLIPMTDDTVSTKLKTDDGSLLDFQEYFVEKKAKPKLTEVVYNGAEKAKVSDQLIKNIEESEIVVIGPSNPILSIGPILSLNKLKEKLSEHNNVYVINPFIENKAIKGPSKNNFEDLGYTSDIQGIKNFYKDVGNKYIVHPGDSDGAEDTVEHNILFNELENSKKLVEFIVNHE
jgi:LPPG:FO 2-phospho-L-lactate transferase